MPLKKYFWVLALLIFACSKNKIDPNIENPNPPEIPNPPAIKPTYWDEDSWIYYYMKQHYLWADDMPLEDSTNKNLAPLVYFKTLLNAQKDRYSYATENLTEIEDFWNGDLFSYGFRYRKFTDSAENQLKLIVSLVPKGSPAEKGGLKRGDIISKIDNQNLSENNLKSLLELPNARFFIQKTDTNYNLNLAKQKFKLDPVQEYKILEIENKKIGYLLYTQFLMESNDELQKIFAYFKSNAIDEIVVDLRFNPGGVTPMAETFASLLAPNLGSSYTLFQGKDNKNLISKRTFTNETNNLSQLSRIFVLTSKSSASSSELIINCLRPYRPVITVGNNTYGKNVISYIISDPKNRFSFALMPAWTQIFNVNMESNYGNSNGIVPDHFVEDNKIPFYPLGDPKETLLKNTLNLIFGKTSKVDSLRNIQLKDDFHHYDSGKSFLNQYL